MSSYIHFFIRSTDRLIPIGTYSRSNSLYTVLSTKSVYEKVKPLCSNDINKAKIELKEYISSYKGCNEQLNRRIDTVSKMSGSCEEKLELIGDMLASQLEYNELIEEHKKAIEYLEFLLDIIDEARDFNYYCEHGEVDFSPIDLDNYIYCGVDCGIPKLNEI